MTPSAVRRLLVRPLAVPLNEPFAIATGARERLDNVLVEARLQDGTRGWGECAPAVEGEKLPQMLAAARKAADALEGVDASRSAIALRRLEAAVPGRPGVSAGFEMALLDAWARSRGVPLWRWFGGAGDRLRTDVTVTIMSPESAHRSALRIRQMGIGTIKIKVGADPEEDLARVAAVRRAAPKASLILDANQGYDARTALWVLKRLKRLRIRPILFEQPTSREDLDGMAEVSRKGGVPVAADESVQSPADAWRVARRRAADVVNVKLMKSGLHGSIEVVRVARAAGLGLMIGGMVETSLAMGCAAHLAAGLGDFRFVDLDTPLWLSKDPMTGLSIGRGGLYDLRPVRAGIGVRPNQSR